MKKNVPISFLSSKLSIILIAAFIVTNCLAFFYLISSRPKIAYVRNLELVYGFNGMKQAQAEYKAQTDAWQANIDTLGLKYQRALADYQKDYKSFSAKEKKEQEDMLSKMEGNLRKYTTAVQDESKSKEAVLTEGILNQINSYVEKFAKSKGYDIVLGSEGKGNILYGTKAYDITEEVLDALNKEHKNVQVPGGK